jgi:hypothetical protein
MSLNGKIANMSLPIVLIVVVGGITISYLLLGVDDDCAEDGRVAQEHSTITYRVSCTAQYPLGTGTKPRLLQMRFLKQISCRSQQNAVAASLLNIMTKNTW